MPQYRFYTVKPDGHLLGLPTDVECPNDQDSVNEAKQFLNGTLLRYGRGAHGFPIPLTIDVRASPFPHV